MKDVYEWGWVGRFTDGGERYEACAEPMSEGAARAYIKAWQDHEDELYPADDEGERDTLHVTYALWRRPKPVVEDWEEVL